MANKRSYLQTTFLEIVCITQREIGTLPRFRGVLGILNINARFGTGTGTIFFKAGVPPNKIHHSVSQKASKSLASKYSLQQFPSNGSRSVVKSLPPQTLNGQSRQDLVLLEIQ